MRLPTLKDSACDPELHVQLLLQKMRQCQQQVDWDEPEAERAEKEVKTEALKELTEWLGGPMAAAELNDAEFGDAMQKGLMEIVRTNLFRLALLHLHIYIYIYRHLGTFPLAQFKSFLEKIIGKLLKNLLKIFSIS
jgi:hypothetical protein